MMNRSHRLFRLLVVMALSTSCSFSSHSAVPLHSNQSTPDPRRTQEALCPSPVWFLRALSVGAAAWTYSEGGTLLHSVASLAAVPPLWPGVSVYRPKPAKGNGPTLDIRRTGMIGRGSYGDRQVSELNYPYLLSPLQELRQLTKIALRIPGADRKGLTQALVETEAQPTREALTAQIGRLRQMLFNQDLANPTEKEKWLKAINTIQEQLQRLEDHWGGAYRQTVERMILELETYLPFVGDEYDNYKRYVQDTEHGLLHSLIVMDRALRLAQDTFAADASLEEAQRAKRLDEAKALYAGIGLYHDLTGLREREDHQVSAMNLASGILHQIRQQGKPVYTAEQVGLIARGCLNHRGQNYQKPIGLLEEIFVDADELLLVEDIQRIYEQPAGAGIFSPRFWGVYRRYIVTEAPQFGSDKRFRHETRTADLYQYLLFTLIERTNPENYRTQAARDWLKESYSRLKTQVIRETEEFAREDQMERRGSLYEVQQVIRLMHRGITELESLLRDRPKARTWLRQQMGTPQELAERLEQFLLEFERRPVKTVRTQDARNYLELAVMQEQHALGLPVWTAYIRQHQAFRAGLQFFDRYLEHPTLDLSPLKKGSREAGAYRCAGFAFGVYLAAADSLQDYFRMVGESSEDLALRDPVVRQTAMTLAIYFLNQMGDAISPGTAAENTRHQLGILKYRTDEPLLLSKRRRFESELLGELRKKQTVNLHVHGSGGLSYHEIAVLCANFREHVHLPSAPQGFDPTQAAHWRGLSYKGRIQSAETFEQPFRLIKELFANDRDFVIHREWYRRLVLASHEEGNRVVAVTSTFDSFQNNPRALKRAVKAAVKGLQDGEQDTEGNIRGLLILGLRKSAPPEEVWRNVTQWIALKKDWLRSFKGDSDRLFGIDSVGYEDRTFDFHALESSFRLAKEAGMWVKCHVGETWETGGLIRALERVRAVVESRLVDQITNPVALMVDAQSLRPEFYSESDRVTIQKLQDSIMRTLKYRGIYAEISPTSNAAMSEERRTEEGWRFVPMGTLLTKMLHILITDDDPGHFDTQFAEEHLRIYQGVTEFGTTGMPQLTRLLKNSEILLRLIAKRLPSMGILPVQGVPGNARLRRAA